MINLYDWTLSQLQTIMENRGYKKYNGEQILRWLYQERVHSFDEMTNLSKSLKEDFITTFSMQLPTIIQKQKSSDGTIKFLLELEDHHRIETVIMKYTYGNAVCVSSQVGCNMGCSFCASGLLKKIRDLHSYEMVGQVLIAQQELDSVHERVSHVVIMGIGEPFDNYENVMNFIYIINEAKGLAIGARHISVSTSGIIPKIKALTEEKLQINLAISLHAPNDQIRNQIMKINHKYPMNELKEALIEYEKKTNRRVTFEYLLLDGINDSKNHALELANYLKGTCCYVNLIPYNQVNENRYQRSQEKNINIFYNVLKNQKINVTIRREFGKDIDAACGQLRAKSEGKV